MRPRAGKEDDGATSGTDSVASAKSTNVISSARYYAVSMKTQTMIVAPNAPLFGDGATSDART